LVTHVSPQCLSTAPVLRIFAKVFGALPLRPFKQASIEKFIVSNLHSFSTFMGELFSPGLALAHRQDRLRFSSAETTLGRTLHIRPDLDYGQFTVSLSLALAHNHLIHPFVLVKHISVLYMSKLCIFRIILKNFGNKEHSK
jgi:hypothetical protein